MKIVIVEDHRFNDMDQPRYGVSVVKYKSSMEEAMRQRFPVDKMFEFYSGQENVVTDGREIQSGVKFHIIPNFIAEHVYNILGNKFGSTPFMDLADHPEAVLWTPSAPEEQLIITYRDNWADEMDLDGFFIIKTALWNRLVSMLEQQPVPKKITKSIGSNEEIHFENYRHFLSHFTAKPISNQELGLLQSIFKDGEPSMGFAYKVFWGVVEMVFNTLTDEQFEALDIHG